MTQSLAIKYSYASLTGGHAPPPGAATPLTAQGIEACAHKLSVQPADIWTVLRVEARGCGYFADRRPVILFERHIFSRRTQGRFDSQASDISNRKAGGYAGGVAEYQRLERAMALDEQATTALIERVVGELR